MRTRIWLAPVALLFLAYAVHGETPSTFQLVVHPGNRMTTLERRFMADVFLKKTSRWPGGEVIRPVDLDADSPVRRRFSQEVLGRSVSAVKSYWQQVIFSGRNVPPPELDADADVLQYVRRYPTAIGYVSGTADVGDLKVVTLK